MPEGDLIYCQAVLIRFTEGCYLKVVGVAAYGFCLRRALGQFLASWGLRGVIG